MKIWTSIFFALLITNAWALPGEKEHILIKDIRASQMVKVSVRCDAPKEGILSDSLLDPFGPLMDNHLNCNSAQVEQADQFCDCVDGILTDKVDEEIQDPRFDQFIFNMIATGLYRERKYPEFFKTAEAYHNLSHLYDPAQANKFCFEGYYDQAREQRGLSADKEFLRSALNKVEREQRSFLHINPMREEQKSQMRQNDAHFIKRAINRILKKQAGSKVSKKELETASGIISGYTEGEDHQAAELQEMLCDFEEAAALQDSPIAKMVCFNTHPEALGIIAGVAKEITPSIKDGSSRIDIFNQLQNTPTLKNVLKEQVKERLPTLCQHYDTVLRNSLSEKSPEDAMSRLTEEVDKQKNLFKLQMTIIMSKGNSQEIAKIVDGYRKLKTDIEEEVTPEILRKKFKDGWGKVTQMKRAMVEELSRGIDPNQKNIDMSLVRAENSLKLDHWFCKNVVNPAMADIENLELNKNHNQAIRQSLGEDPEQLIAIFGSAKTQAESWKSMVVQKEHDISKIKSDIKAWEEELKQENLSGSLRRRLSRRIRSSQRRLKQLQGELSQMQIKEREAFNAFAALEADYRKKYTQEQFDYIKNNAGKLAGALGLAAQTGGASGGKKCSSCYSYSRPKLDPDDVLSNLASGFSSVANGKSSSFGNKKVVVPDMLGEDGMVSRKKLVEAINQKVQVPQNTQENYTPFQPLPAMKAPASTGDMEGDKYSESAMDYVNENIDKALERMKKEKSSQDRDASSKNLAEMIAAAINQNKGKVDELDNIKKELAALQGEYTKLLEKQNALQEKRLKQKADASQTKREAARAIQQKMNAPISNPFSRNLNPRNNYKAQPLTDEMPLSGSGVGQAQIRNSGLSSGLHGSSRSTASLASGSSLVGDNGRVNIGLVLNRIVNDRVQLTPEEFDILGSYIGKDISTLGIQGGKELLVETEKGHVIYLPEVNKDGKLVGLKKVAEVKKEQVKQQVEELAAQLEQEKKRIYGHADLKAILEDGLGN